MQIHLYQIQSSYNEGAGILDIEKVKKWLDLTNQYRMQDDWVKVFSHYPPKHFFEHNNNPFPKIDIYQDELTNIIIVEIPGVRQEDIQLFLKTNRELMIKGKINFLFPNWIQIKKERYLGEFERIIRLPEPTETHLIKTVYQAGLLQVTYPRATGDTNQF